MQVTRKGEKSRTAVTKGSRQELDSNSLPPCISCCEIQQLPLPTRLSFSSAGIQQFFSHILKHIHGALHSDLAGQDGVLILDAEYSVVAYFHVGAHHVLPQVGAMPVANRSEDGRSAGDFFRLKGE